MYSVSSPRRNINPRENASWLSIITLVFAIKIFRNCLRTGGASAYEIIAGFESEKLGDNLQIQWESGRKTKLQFVKIVIGMFKWQLLLLGIGLLMIEPTVIALHSLLIGKLVGYFTPGQTDISLTNALLCAIGLPALSLIFIGFFNVYFLFLREISLKIQTACCSLMYRKCLKLNRHAIGTHTKGKVVTLMTKDVIQFCNSGLMDFIIGMPVGVIDVVVMTYLMYNVVGASALIGASLLLLIFIPQVYLGKQTAKYRLKTAEKTDERVRITQEILNAIRIIKMYTWELFFSKSVSSLRKKEIGSLRLIFYLKALALSIGQLSSTLAFYICVMTYIAFGNHITAEKAYIVTGCFGALRGVLTIFMPVGIAQIAELTASIKRITDFLLLEEVEENPVNQDISARVEEPRIIVKDLTVKSDNGIDVLDNLNLDIKSGITFMTGPVGAGKSAFLKLILGEVKKTAGAVEVSGIMAYASQDPWLFPGSIRQNIIFTEQFDQERYDTIIDVCALKKDLDSFRLGDKTCVTDRGLNLSKGQKARINLARAVYKKADIYLLDDCLSSVDTRVGKHIFENCIRNFLKNSLCILVTHHLQFINEADNIVVLNNGRVKFKGSYLKLTEYDPEEYKRFVTESDVDIEKKEMSSGLAEDMSNESESIDEHSKLLDIQDTNIYAETRQEGSVNISVYYRYFTSGGGIKIFILVVALAILAQAAMSWSDYFVSFWVDMEQSLSGFRHNQTTNSTEYKNLEASHSRIMIQYSFVIIAATVFTLLRAFTFFIFSSKASINLHNIALDRIINATMKFFDVNLFGNVINRFSRDFAIIDEQTPFAIFDCVRVLLTLLGILFVVSSVNALFLIPSAIFAVILYFAQRLYIPTGRSIRRLEGSTRSPVIGHLTTTLEGLTTIRASQAQEILKREFDKHQDLYNSVSYMDLATTRAFGFYLDTLAVIYMAAVIFIFLFCKTDTLAGKVGLAITQSFSLTGILQWAVRRWAELENQMTSTERVLEYTTTETERKSGKELANWPTKGSIIFKDVSLQYSPTSDRVLKNVSLSIQPKEKIGVVGRTGAGKTSIVSSLFRLYEYSGTISIDDVDISNLMVDLVRSKISIIPQDPVVFSGTVRTNLDPNGKHSDAKIWDALREVEIKKLLESLDTDIFEGGSGFSVGQRQQFCLARAILNDNKILVLDEATANVDPQTDSLIQETIRRRFKDCTVITIAHRLHTILDSDRVLVIDSGVAVEFDKPSTLLKNRNGHFYKMIKEAGLL